MSEARRLVEDPVGAAARDLSALGGVLVCFSCNEVRPIGSEKCVLDHLNHGWPMCCGYTMHWVTAEQLGGTSTSPISQRAIDALRAKGVLS